MKIFNWVHRKFHHKDGFIQDVNKAAELVRGIEAETQLVLLPEHVTFDSILTIGTFGFGNVCSIQKEETRDEEIENELDNEEEEVNPLLSDSFRSGFEERDVEKYEVGLESTDSECKKGMWKEKERKERVTLADLLVADSDGHVKYTKKGEGRVVLEEKDSNYKNKSTDVGGVKKKGQISFAKKLIPGVGEDTRPFQKLHQLMRRMTKRKIHPDMEGKHQKAGDDAPIKPTTIHGLIADEYGANESVSLLPKFQIQLSDSEKSYGLHSWK